jgi:hypothetical protein
MIFSVNTTANDQFGYCKLSWLFCYLKKDICVLLSKSNYTTNFLVKNICEFLKFKGYEKNN